MAVTDFSARAHSLVPSKIRDVAELGMGDPSVIPLWFGEANWTSPDLAIQSAKVALDAGQTRYQPNNGVPALREAIAAYLHRVFDRQIERPRITVTASGMQGLALAAQAIVQPGDPVVILQPGWPNIGGCFAIAGGEIRPFGLQAVDGKWRLDLGGLLEQLTPDVRCFVVNSPNNPTGWTLSREDQRILLEHCRKNGIWLVSDEVYSRLYRHGDAAPSFLELAEADDRVIVVSSFSKAWAMTGWRLGWLVTPPELEGPLAMLTEFNVACAPAFIQAAGIDVLEQGEGFVQEQRQRIETAFDYMSQRLGTMNRVDFIEPDGAFYAFFRIEGVTDSLATAKDILMKSRVGLAPGIAFGEQGEGYLRLCYAQPADLLREALDRLEAYFRA
ncbi:MAG: pyridoxal phosphate-dependent aminotransferase [Alphaproteobacteria bacterium]